MEYCSVVLYNRSAVRSRKHHTKLQACTTGQGGIPTVRNKPEGSSHTAQHGPARPAGGTFVVRTEHWDETNALSSHRSVSCTYCYFFEKISSGKTNLSVFHSVAVQKNTINIVICIIFDGYRLLYDTHRRFPWLPFERSGHVSFNLPKMVPTELFLPACLFSNSVCSRVAREGNRAFFCVRGGGGVLPPPPDCWRAPAQRLARQQTHKSLKQIEFYCAPHYIPVD